MEFSYQAYGVLLSRIRTAGYTFEDYDSCNCAKKPCILRHDVDFDMALAVAFAEHEALDYGVTSTYFLLLNTDFYNLYSAVNRKRVQRLLSLGHKIGLHFDETQYDIHQDWELLKLYTEKERLYLSDIAETEINVVSMHRPSPMLLDANVTFSGMVNSYGKQFFHDYKYYSDSRMHWREDVETGVTSGAYPALHILTHPFWYREQAMPTEKLLLDWFRAGAVCRWDCLNDNFRELDEFVNREEV